MAVNLPQKTNEENEEEKNKKTNSAMEIINNFLLRLSRVPFREKLFFIQHLGVMLRAGISLGVAVKTLAKETKSKYFKKILSDVAASINKGTSLTESLRPHEKIFGELFISMVEAGEISGKLEEVMGKLYIQMKKHHELVSKVKGAITYPVVIIVAMLGIGTFMMIVVVPRITSMFADLDAELPLPTRVLISISNAMAQNGILTIFILALFIAAVVKILKTNKGKYYFQAVLLKTPVFSTIIKKINLAKFARTISSLLKTDIMIIKTFRITGSVLGNLHYRAALFEMSEKIKKGGQINEVIKMYPKLFPPVVVQMITVGEQTGELDTILEELADFYEDEVNQIMENLPSIIEPLLILGLGVGIGAVAVAIIMPMYSITSAI